MTHIKKILISVFIKLPYNKKASRLIDKWVKEEEDKK